MYYKTYQTAWSNSILNYMFIVRNYQPSCEERDALGHFLFYFINKVF